jgi:hypothetical protein
MKTLPAQLKYVSEKSTGNATTKIYSYISNNVSEQSISKQGKIFETVTIFLLILALAVIISLSVFACKKRKGRGKILNNEIEMKNFPFSRDVDKPVYLSLTHNKKDRIKEGKTNKKTTEIKRNAFTSPQCLSNNQAPDETDKRVMSKHNKKKTNLSNEKNLKLEKECEQEHF